VVPSRALSFPSSQMTDPRNSISTLHDGSGGWLGHRSDPDVIGSGPGIDWIKDVMPDLSATVNYLPPDAKIKTPPKILVLYGSLRTPKSFSRLLALECARLLELLGAEVRVYDPHLLPVRDPAIEDHVKVQELRELVLWSEGHIWCAPELHGGLCGTFKNQIDWIPLDTGSVRPTQGKSVAVLQVNGGSQSFNTVNALRLLARWMRMSCNVNQSSVPMAWKEFDDDGRMKPSSYRDRVVDVIEEYYKFHVISREFAALFTDRYSERKEKRENEGKLLTQAQKESAKATS